jgi:hypothetical protein
MLYYRHQPGFICIMIFARPGDFVENELIYLAAANIIMSAFGLEWFIHGLEDFSFLARRSFLIKIASLAAIFLFDQELF